MFESGYEGWSPPLLDEPELTEEQWQAQVEAQIAADPDPWPEPTVAEINSRDAEVIALAESAPITGWLLDALNRIDVNTLTEDQAIGYALAQDRIANAAHARRGLGVNQAVACSPDDPQLPRELHAAGQLGAALGLGSGATDSLIADAGQIAAALPGTQTMALAGDLAWRKASSIASNTLGMTAEQAGRVEDKVLAKAADRSPARHDAAVRRAVDQVDPEFTDRKRKQRERDIRMVRQHYGAGMSELFIAMPSEDADLTWTAANAYARRCKAAGDPRTLDQLRVAFLPHAAGSYLSHGDPSYCDRICDEPTPATAAAPGDGSNPDAETAPEPPTPPTQHGRPVALHLTWDLTSLLGITNHCGELRDSGTLLPPTAMRDLLAGGGRIRRMVIDPHTGEQLDLTSTTWALPPTDGRAHRQPVVLTITTTARWDELPVEVRTAVQASGPALAAMLRELLDSPLTADNLDSETDAETPSPALAEYVASRAAHPVNPAAGPTPASAADLDHHHARSDGGPTTTANLGPLVRRWHRLKTFAGWTVRQLNRSWEWTSPTGRKYTIEPHDYRLGP